MARWIRVKTGVRFREHPTRKHGLAPDRYFCIYHRVDGRQVEAGLGWASEGWTATKAAAELARLKRAKSTGEGPATLQEARDLAERERTRQAAVGITLSRLWADDYAPQAAARLKPKSFRREEQLFRLHLEPLLGKRILSETTERDVEKVMDLMRSAGQTPRSIEYALGLLNRLWKLALRRGIVEAASPTSRIPKPRVANTRLRCFSPTELQAVLESVNVRDGDAHDLCLFASLTGARFSECAGLRWEHVDLIRESATFVETKNRDSREVFLSPELMTMLERRGPGKTGEHVFTMRDRRPWGDIPYAFRAAIRDLGLNEGRGPRERLTFHSLRHTAATFAARRGVPVKDLQELFGWRTAAMVFRYAKGSEDVKRRAARGLAQTLMGTEPGRVVPFPDRRASGDDDE